MMCRYRNWIICLSGAFTLFVTGCKKQTDDHNAITDDALKNNLFELISANPDLSTFTNYLKQTGYDQVLASSRNYTAFAPTNTVLATLDPAISGNADKLKKFIANHLAGQLYYTTTVTTAARILMQGGKYNNMLGSKIGEANITGKDKYASNGVLQVIDKLLPALDNCWEFLNNSPLAPVKQKNFMLSLFRNVFDTTNAVVIGVNPVTGDPIYQPGTDSVYTNLFWNSVHDLRDESKEFTLFMLTDAAWDAEVNKYKLYYVTGTADSTTNAASWSVVKDFATDKVYDPASIPDTVLSKFGTKVPVSASAIMQTIKTSNGIIYILNQADVQPFSKFKPYLIQAESYAATSHDRRGNTYFRDRFNTVTGKDFTDVLVLGHGVALFNIRYDIREVPSIKYKAYWVAVNDFQTATFTQKLGIGTATSTTFGYTTVALNNFNEVYIGEFTMSQYRPLFNIYLTAANSTTAAANPLVCDYIRLEPSL
ncbi:MAG: fasciclin domain-containing protein [Chitinophagaceae bacterium]|nr:fasciclin domain-containing protein [Chitinophagaceae bacterium]